MRTDRIRTVIACTFVALMISIGHAQPATATPDPTEPPTTEPPTTEPPATEPTSEEPTDTASQDDAESTPEPGNVSPAVWIGVIVLVVAAVLWAVRQTSKSSTPVDNP